MRTLLAMLMALTVSGDNEVTVTGHLGDSVVLPCPCSNRNVAMKFSWQMDKPMRIPVYPVDDSNGKSVSIAEMLEDKNDGECSIRLNNITENDIGAYRCSYYVNNLYKYDTVHLQVFANYTVCLSKNNSGGNVQVHCVAESRHREAQIKWYSDGKPLPDALAATINSMDHNGLYHFKSTLISNDTSKIKCDIKTKGILPKVNYNDCKTPTFDPGNYGRSVGDKREQKRWYFKLIPILLVIVITLVLIHRWKFSRPSSRINLSSTEITV